MRTLTYDPLWKKLIDVKMTKTELASKAGISRTTVSKMAKNEPVHLDIILKICEVLDCDIVDVVSILPTCSSGRGSEDGHTGRAIDPEG